MKGLFQVRFLGHKTNYNIKKKEEEKIMRNYAKEQILENYGMEALEKIQEHMTDSNANQLLVYSEPEYGTFEIIGGIITNHSNSIDDVLELLDVNMDDFAEQQGWDGWNYEALELIDVK